MASTSHGGYLFRLESLTAARLLTLAREALRLEEESSADCSVRLSLMHPGKLVGVSYRAPFTGEEDSGRWYLTHHSLARLLSRELSSAVHVYALDPDELEEVTSYAKGRRVGGERLEYAHIELSEDDLELLVIPEVEMGIQQVVKSLDIVPGLDTHHQRLFFEKIQPFL